MLFLAVSAVAVFFKLPTRLESSPLAFLRREVSIPSGTLPAIRSSMLTLSPEARFSSMFLAPIPLSIAATPSSPIEAASLEFIYAFENCSKASKPYLAFLVSVSFKLLYALLSPEKGVLPGFILPCLFIKSIPAPCVVFLRLSSALSVPIVVKLRLSNVFTSSIVTPLSFSKLAKLSFAAARACFVSLPLNSSSLVKSAKPEYAFSSSSGVLPPKPADFICDFISSFCCCRRSLSLESEAASSSILF